jgi:restriction endonuclease S subunit
MTAALPSLSTLQPNTAWGSLPLFDRTGWKRVAFGEFAESIGERAEPRDAQEEIYVGLEHLDPQCLHIRRWGMGSDVIGGKLRFRKGDIIFGKRRAYQRKLAVAAFGGICSAHAMVIRARPDKVLPEFLPSLMMSDRFMNRAVEISVGSLSPTINWTTLKLETFDLPPLDQQRRIAEILWAVDEDEQFKHALAKAADALQTAEIEALLDDLFMGPCKALDGVLTGSPESGSSAPPSPTETGHYVLSLASLTKAGYSRGNLKPIPPTKAMLDSRLSKDDFLISRSNTQELVGLVGIFDEEREDVSFPDTMMRLPVDESIVSKRFLQIVLQSTRGRLHMMRTAAGTSNSMKKINRRSLNTFKVPVPSRSVQAAAIAKIEKGRGLCISAHEACARSMRLKTDLIQLFT